MIHHSKKIKKYQGFTLIELLIVVAISIFLAATGVALSANYSMIQNLQSTATDVRSMLFAARSEAQSVISQPCQSSVFNGVQVSYCAYNNKVDKSCSSRCVASPLPGIEEDISCGGPTPTLYVLQTQVINPQITLTPDHCSQLFQSLGSTVNGSGNIQISNGSQSQTVIVNPNGVVQ